MPHRLPHHNSLTLHHNLPHTTTSSYLPSNSNNKHIQNLHKVHHHNSLHQDNIHHHLLPTHPLKMPHRLNDRRHKLAIHDDLSRNDRD
ncbi:hypothetical protein DL95DRAFT_380838, partial [Leptodontidium sp. 2 PMI_412]